MINIWIFIVLTVILLIVVLILLLFQRRKYIQFTKSVYDDLDALIAGKKIKPSQTSNEMLRSKIAHKTEQLSDVITHHEETNMKQKEEIQNIVSDISHQLNTPLANLLMYSETVLNNDLSPDRINHCLDTIHSQTLKMEFLIESLIKMSRLESNSIVLKPSDTSPKKCIEKAVEGIKPKAMHKNINLNLRDIDSELRIFCDPKWTSEALFNILENAVKYTDTCGEISIEITSYELYSRIMISDNGIGIAEENTNNIFKRFFREAKVHNQDGIGLGLYLSREIITKQNGYIKVRSEVNAGTDFSVYLPNNSF